MMWIVGADALGSALSEFRGGPLGRFAARQLDHVPWDGIRFYDTIFPLFLFLAGVAIPFSMDKMLANGSRGAALARVARRTLVLFVIGIFYYGGFDKGLEHVRIMGVLQRIGLCYGASCVLYIRLPKAGLAWVIAALLLGYWALLRFVPVPGFGPGDFAEGHNLTNWIDAHYLPLRKWDGDHDPEGLLSTFPAVATCLLGVLSGCLLRDPARSQASRVAALAAAGCVLMAAGFLWGLEFPVIKKIWSSSFVLVAGGWSMLLLSAFYLLADVWNLGRWLQPFAWVGANSLTIYLLSNVIDFGALARRFVGGSVQTYLNDTWRGLGGLTVAVTSILLCTLICGFLYRRRLFLRL
jgi:predicted acyltransferase